MKHGHYVVKDGFDFSFEITLTYPRNNLVEHFFLVCGY